MNSNFAASKLRIAFVANDAWFFARHFAPAIKAALRITDEVFAFLPTDSTLLPKDISSVSIQTNESTDRKMSFSPFGTIKLVWSLHQLSPSIVVGYSLRSILLLSIALPFVRHSRFVLVVTGLGLMDLESDVWGGLKRSMIFAIIQIASRSKRVWFIFENGYDRERIGLPKSNRQITVMGAGVDPQVFSPIGMPDTETLQIGFVGRLIWSKGVDVAVEAVTNLCAAGVPVQLNIYGKPDFANPRSFSEQTISKWQKSTCIRYFGFTESVQSIWKDNHIAIVPSRGGEGLPRSLLEAASCGKPSIVTAVAGCVDFVRDNMDGLIAAPNSVDALQEAIKYFHNNRERIAEMGESARQRLLDTATTDKIEKAYLAIFCPFASRLNNNESHEVGRQ